jgi:TctA family transporter
MIPGIGGTVIDWIAYGVAAQTSRNSETFGTGDIRGVIAPESANNAKEGGALVPTLLFGIPGSGTTAVLLGGLILLGVQPGPRMVTDRLDVLLVIILSLVVANVMGAAVCLVASRWFVLLCQIPARKLAPFLIPVITVAALQSTKSLSDLWVFIALGVVSWQMKRHEWPRPPLLVGFVLGTAAERYLWISMSRYGFTWLTRPGVIIIGIVTIAAIALSARRTKR